MSIRTMSVVWQHSKLGGTELLLLLAISDFASDEGMAWPSVATLAGKIRMSERGTHYLLRKLEASGELVIERNKGPKGCNLFRVQILQGAIHAGVQPSSPGGATQFTRGVQPSSPEPSVNRHEPSVSREKIAFDGSSFKNLNGHLAAWKTAYPAIDVEGELRKAAAWLVSNPKNKKSAYSRFLNSWLSRAQDKAPRVPVSDRPRLAL
jgi:hypothetical protein